jgi:hypothetical protein
MTQDEIIEMACQAFGGLIKQEERPNFIAFANLVAAKEREKFCALLRQLHDSISLASDPSAIKVRGEA